MSTEEIAPQALENLELQQPQQPQQPEQPELPDQNIITEQDQETYDQMTKMLSKMNAKIEKAKKKLNEGEFTQKKSKTDEISDKLIQSKETSQIITKQNLLTDITQSYQKVVIEVYSDNSKLKKKIQSMAKLLKEQSNKIYDHSKKQKDLVKQNEELRLQISRLKDQRLMVARGGNNVQKNSPSQDAKDVSINNLKKKSSPTNNGQAEDFDFWSMPQNDYGKKNKNFVQDSNLWVNQKEVTENVFITQQQSTSHKKKK